jgi:hypothetical protein
VVEGFAGESGGGEACGDDDGAGHGGAEAGSSCQRALGVGKSKRECWGGAPDGWHLEIMRGRREE